MSGVIARPRSRVRRWALWILLGLAALALVSIGAGWSALRASLPLLDGRVQTRGATVAGIRIERDATGIVTIRAESVDDMAFGLGFAHAQDRYFQMDLSRRLAAGELSELFGAIALPQDRRARAFGFRRVATAALSDATPAHRQALEAYARGVNAGLSKLGARPWEYWVLRSKPQPWREEDTILVAHAMWWNLQYGDIERERIVRRIESQLESLAAAGSGAAADSSAGARFMQFLFPRSTEWDSPNYATLAQEADAARSSRAGESPPVPSPDVLDLRQAPASPSSAVIATVRREAAAARTDPWAFSPDARELAGSNNWAVGGRLTSHGAALVANDMHLGLGVPPTWYRARLIVAGAEPVELNGVTLPGAPVMLAGSNGSIAWGFTNSYGDWVDVSTVSCDLARNEYLTALGTRSFTLRQELIRVRGDEPSAFTARESPLGVLVDISDDGSTCSLARWLAREPGATNLAIADLMAARSVAEALALAPRIGVPQQNLVVGDRDGHIGWSIIGRIPVDAMAMTSDAPIAWREPAAPLQLLDPESGLLWTANARSIDGEAERAIGNDEVDIGVGYALGARARQIRDDLRALTAPVSPGDMLRIQLDDRALFLERWRRLMLGVLDEEAIKNAPQRIELKRWVESWDARAGVDSVGYRIVRTFRDHAELSVWQMLMRGIGLAADTPMVSRQFEGPLWRLVTEQPLHLLAPDQADWRSLLLAQIDATAAQLRDECGELARCTWGQVAPVKIRHPLSRSLPWASWLIDMPTRRLPGDQEMPRVQGAAFGASQRFAVAPGRESDGYLQLPGGQSAHPLSPFFRASFDGWARGLPTPFLPGPATHSIEVVP